MVYKIFISYSTKDIELANQIKTILESQIKNISIFLYNKSMIEGDIDYTIINEIHSSDLILLLFSQNTKNSIYVQNEIGIAKGSKKPFIVLKRDEDVKIDGIISRDHYLPFYSQERINETWPRVLRYVEDKSNKKDLGTAIIVLGGLLAAGYLFFGDKK